MTWLKNNLVLIIVVFFVAEITFTILRDVGVAPSRLALVIQSILTPINVALIGLSCVILLNLNDDDDTRF